MKSHTHHKHNYRTIKLPTILALSTFMLMSYSVAANAEYDIQVVNPPGGLFTQTFGINNAGKVTGGSNDGVLDISFVYDMKSGEYTTIDPDFGPLDISNSGVMVGQINGVCAIRDKKGNITTLFPPSYAVDSSCSVRGVNSKGKVSGFEVDAANNWLGFTYDPKKDTYEEFLPSGQTIAHAINAKGQNVGSVNLDPDAAFLGSPAGRYGYLREANGAVKFFSVTQSFPGQTRARGISESGLVAGFYFDAGFESKSYVTTLSSGGAFDSITLESDQIIYQKPCNADLPPPPSPGYDLYSDFFASQVRNDGVVVGSCSDTYYNPTTNDVIFNNVGFIATPVK